MASRRDSKDKNLPAILPTGVIAPSPIQVESPAFSGSLAMLFSCVRDRKVDLLEVPLFPICEAYFNYLIEAELADLDEAAAALAALAYLLERKAWALLPTPEPEPEELEEPLELAAPTVYEFDVVIDTLRRFHEERSRRYFRPSETGPDPADVPLNLGEITAEDLARAFEALMRRAQPDPMDMPAKPRRSLSEQMGVVWGFRALWRRSAACWTCW
ncbi:MAG TPA: segregation/condensation protein A, partial [Fimbriimonadaceae bacterium]|nr:segregation/condensation protein A [Fimbriimonadaceae bacterium]